MTGTHPVNPAAPADLAARLFRALYPGYELHTIGGAYVAVPAGTPCFAGPSLGQIARQISTRTAVPDPAAPGRPESGAA